MSEAPERIWAFAPDIFDNCSLWQDMPSPAGDTIEYIRADHVDALLKAEREKHADIAKAVAKLVKLKEQSDG